MAALMITTGAMRGRRIECDRPLIIGREDVDEGVDVVIDDAEMSRRHAVLTPVAEGLQIEDLGSLNGTFVNGNKISGKVILGPDAEVKLGTTQLTVELPRADAPIVSPGNPTVMRKTVTPASDEPIAPLPQPTVVRGQPKAPAQGADTPGDEPIAPLPQPTVVRGQPKAPAQGADTPADEPIAPLPQPTVVRGQPKAPAQGADTPDEPIAPLMQPTVARSTPIVPDTGKTALRDQPLVSTQEPTVVRDAVKGLPTPQAAGGPGAPAGGPPKIPKPVLMVMKSPAGKVLLPIMLKLPMRARPLVPLLFMVLFVLGNAVGIYFIIRLIT
jgi:pSer/pThr/pTyr-binding forkhead associated (FHA) protein